MARVLRGVERLRLPTPNSKHIWTQLKTTDMAFMVSGVVYGFRNTYGQDSLREDFHYVHHMYSLGYFAKGRRLHLLLRFSACVRERGTLYE